jgi:hypothetical protein
MAWRRGLNLLKNLNSCGSDLPGAGGNLPMGSAGLLAILKGAGQAPNASGMVDQQALARQGQGCRGALQERLRGRGVVQEQKDFPGAPPQFL